MTNLIAVSPVFLVVLGFWVSSPSPAPPQVVVEASFDPTFDPRGAADTPGEIQGRVLDASGKPAAGTHVVVRPRPTTGYPGLFDRFGAPSRAMQTELASVFDGKTGTQGEFACAVEPGRVHEIVLEGARGEIARVDFASAGERVQVRLAPPARMKLTVREKKTGRFVPQVDVAAARVESGALRQLASVTRILAQGKTDGDGRVTLDRLPPGVVTLQVQPGGFGALSTSRMRVKAGEERDFELWIDATAHRVKGVVLDEKGAGLSGAEIDSTLEFRAPTRTNEKGEFTLDPLIAEDNARFFVRSKGFGTERVRLQAPIAAEVKTVVQLKRGRSVRGVCVDPAGKPLADAEVAFLNDPDVQDGPEINDVALVRSGADGSFLVPDLRRDVTHFLVARHPRSALTFRHLALDELSKDEIDIGALTLSDPTRLAGTVFNMATTVQPGVDVLLCASPSDRDSLRTGKSFNAPFETLITSVRSDSLGRFAFGAVPAGIVAPVAQNERGSARLPDLKIAAGSPREGIDLHIVSQQLAPAQSAGLLLGTVAGRALEQDGAPSACALVVLTPQPASGLTELSTFTDERGMFAFQDVAASHYGVVVSRWQGIDHASQLLWRKVLAPGETSVLGDLALTRCIPVRGRVILESGVSGRTWLVRVRSEIHALANACVETDADGRFAFSIEEGAPITISVLPLALDPSKPRSALNAAPPRETVVEAVTGPSEIEIRVPAAK